MIGVKRSADAPRILAEGTARDRYRSAEVVDRLMEDFHGKCYVCEITPLQSMEVEHLLPHKGGAYAQRMFDWNNLFLSCAHCNSVKNKQKYEAGIIDCCRRDPEALIEQELAEDGVHVRALTKDDGEAELTADLIEEVFMSDNPRIRRYESEGRLKELQRCMNLLYKNLEAYQRNREDAFARRNIESLLSPWSKFAGFTRCYVRKHLDDYPEMAACVMHDENRCRAWGDCYGRGGGALR